MSDDWFNSILEAAPTASPSSTAVAEVRQIRSDLCPSVNAHLQACGLGGVTASLDRGVLALSGSVDSLYERQLAVYYVRKFTRLAGISDRISVRNQVQKQSAAARLADLADVLRQVVGEWYAINAKAVWGCLLFVAVMAMLQLRQGESAIPRLPVTPVTGEVLVNGVAPAGVQVILHPQGHLLPKGTAAMGNVRADGRFSVGIYGDAPGVPAGKYIVTLHWFRGRGEGVKVSRNPIPPEYSSAKSSPLKLTVSDQPQELPVIEIATQK